MNTFRERASEMQHVTPKTELESVLKRYAWAGSHQVLDIVLDNWRVLETAGLLAEAFVYAWSTNKHGVPNWTQPFMNEIFLQLYIGHLEKMRAAGDPIPDGDRFTVYRGVAGVGRKRRVSGYSWSSDFEIAKSFAELRQNRYRLPDPAVYRAEISRADVFAYINESGRNEQEFLAFPPVRTKRVWGS